MAQGRPGGLRGQGGKAAGVLGNSPDIRRVGVHKFAGVWGSERAPVVPGGESLGFVEFCIQPHVVQCMLMVNRGSDVKERDHGRQAPKGALTSLPCHDRPRDRPCGPTWPDRVNADGPVWP